MLSKKIFSRFAHSRRSKLNMADALPHKAGLRTINLAKRRYSFRVADFFKTLSVLSAIMFLVLGSVVAPTTPTANAQSAEERAALEKELRDLEGQITQYQSQISAYQKQGKSLSGEIGTLNAQISRLNLQIRATNLKISDLGGKITATQAKINELEVSVKKSEGNLAQILRTMYQKESASTVEILLKNSSVSSFMDDLTSMASLQENLNSSISQIKALRDELSNKKTELTLAKADAEVLRVARESEKGQVDSTKSQKNKILTVTKGQESKYQTMLKTTQAKANDIRARLFNLQGGGAMSFGQAYEYAKVSSKATGVRPAFLLAVLAQESALGKNVGQCTYHQAMNPKDHQIFIQIAQKVGLNPETQKVSCPNADGIYGGAMGPAQFLPSTWRGYEARIAALVGRSPSPWNNQDAFIAAGLYLKDAGASSNERMAAAKYYCGGRWNRYVCTNVYAQGVLDRAYKFQADIDILNS